MGSESTSNSMKFPPLKASDLKSNVMALIQQTESPDISYSSGEDSDNSPQKFQPLSYGHQSTTSQQVTINTSLPRSLRAKEELLHMKVPENKENNPFLGHNYVLKKSGTSKEKNEEQNMSNCTYPGRSCGDESCPSRHPATEVKKRNGPFIRNNINTNPRSTPSLTKCTPELNKYKPSHNKSKGSTPRVKPIKTSTLVNAAFKTSTPVIKVSTPVIKSGIKKFTPNSGRSSRRSNKKDSTNTNTKPHIDSARCLFPEPARRPTEAPHPAVVPETPSNCSSQSVAATPSYPATNSSKISLKSKIIKGKSYMFIRKLGSGGSSEVFKEDNIVFAKVMEVGECREYAVKCVNMAVERSLYQGYINEVRLLRELQSSDRVIQLHAYEYDKSNQTLNLVLDIGETDLSSFLKARQATGLPAALVLYYWEEMLHAVNHIHQKGVVHADLKPANFLLVCGRLKLIDFGIASAISTDATSVERPCAAGTFSYISPEALMGGAGRYETTHDAKDDAPIKISFKSDVWSLGCILYSMVYGCTPFGHIANVYAKVTAIVDPKHVINYPPAEHMPASLTNAMKWCLTYNAKSRPSVQQLLDIRYLCTTTQSLPESLLSKLEAHVTPEEYALLRKANV